LLIATVVKKEDVKGWSLVIFEGGRKDKKVGTPKNLF